MVREGEELSGIRCPSQKPLNLNYKNMLEINEKKVPAVRIDPSLHRYDNVVLLAEKLAKANEQLKTYGFPKLPDKKHSR